MKDIKSRKDMVMEICGELAKGGRERHNYRECSIEFEGECGVMSQNNSGPLRG
jgi:hypothetical protein